MCVQIKSAQAQHALANIHQKKLKMTNKQCWKPFTRYKFQKNPSEMPSNWTTMFTSECTYAVLYQCIYSQPVMFAVFRICICILYLSPKCIRLSHVSCLLMESKQVRHHHICNNKTRKIKLYINIYKSQRGIFNQQKFRG